MSVTVEQIEAVRQALMDDPQKRKYDTAIDQLLAYADRMRFTAEVMASPHADLARKMFNLVREDCFDDQRPEDGRHWLLAADAARQLLIAQRPQRTYGDI